MPSGYHQQQVKVKKVYVHKKVYVPVPVVPEKKKSKWRYNVSPYD